MERIALKSRLLFIAGFLGIFLMLSSPARAITVVDPFGSSGEGGWINGQTLNIGPGGEVFELDSGLNITGMDLNGGVSGTTGILGLDHIPSGLDFSFTYSLSDSHTDLTLTYTFVNNTGGVLPGVQFFSLLDADIDRIDGDFDDEFAFMAGTVGIGATDADPDSWEIDDPFGDIFDNLNNGSLDNSVHSFGPGDVVFALGFDLGDLNPLDMATIDVLISEDLDSIGSLKLLQLDIESHPTFIPTFITMSGQANVEPIPEPATMALFGIGMVGLAGAGVRRRFKKEKKQLK